MALKLLQNKLKEKSMTEISATATGKRNRKYLININMADEEKAPLLKFSEDDENEGPRQRLHQMRQTDALRGITGFTDGTISISASASVSSNLTETSDHIVCVFVVTFDTRSGNMIEWCMPEDFDLDGVEFKAMVSGSHTQIKDFVYFRKDNMYGLACFENMPVQSEIERGARMKSVGILSTSYTLLYKHMQFLETQVRHQLETPGKYSQLHAFYEDKKGTLSSSDTQEIIRMPTPASTPSTSSREFLPEMKITHPAGCFSQFMKFFGVQIFVLWKFALLQQRILFFSPPPIGVVCYRVYCACCLSKHDLGAMGHNVKPHFYVNVADIETLESEVSYIACTTEKIFESKPNLYDVYVDNQVLKTSSLHLNDLLKVSNADREKYTKLNNQRSESRFSFEQLGEEADNEEELFTIMQTSEFLLPEQSLHIFKSKNQPLLSTYIALTLLDVSCTQDRQLTSEHMKGMGLDPNGDRAFLMELVEHYGIDVVLMVDNPCCPK